MWTVNTWNIVTNVAGSRDSRTAHSLFQMSHISFEHHFGVCYAFFLSLRFCCRTVVVRLWVCSLQYTRLSDNMWTRLRRFVLITHFERPWTYAINEFSVGIDYIDVQLTLQINECVYVSKQSETYCLSHSLTGWNTNLRWKWNTLNVKRLPAINNATDKTRIYPPVGKISSG